MGHIFQPSNFQIVPYTDIVAYLPMAEDSGNTCFDGSYNSNTGTLINAPTWEPVIDKHGCRLAFVRGSSQYVNVAHSASINVGDVIDSYSIVFWIRFTDTVDAARDVLGKGSAAPYPFQFRVNTSGQMTFSIAQGANTPTVTGAVDVRSTTVNTWHHIVGVRDAANA